MTGWQRLGLGWPYCPRCAEQELERDPQRFVHPSPTIEPGTPCVTAACEETAPCPPSE